MKLRTGMTKVMFYLSSAFLAILIVSYIMVSPKMDYTKNYCFSDKSELLIFEQKLAIENISFSQLSDTTVNISKDDEKRADNIFEQISK
ncbi:MAG: hypothetical protein MR908_07845 [Firmicutes bacterium]|nr:hypothetical protein [Bacillota bacterium]